MNYPTISLDGWKQVGEGGNGATYINAKEPDVLLKVSRLADGTEQAMSKEFLPPGLCMNSASLHRR